MEDRKVRSFDEINKDISKAEWRLIVISNLYLQKQMSLDKYKEKYLQYKPELDNLKKELELTVAS